MNSEDIKKIAESMGYETRYIWDGVIEILISCDDVGMEDWQIFDPYKDDAQAFKVLEDLVGRGLDPQLYFWNEDEKDPHEDPFEVDYSAIRKTSIYNSGSGNTLKEAICKAYLELIES